jgi:hypothetical protein
VASIVNGLTLPQKLSILQYHVIPSRVALVAWSPAGAAATLLAGQSLELVGER